jgi:hypothetical protein
LRTGGCEMNRKALCLVALLALSASHCLADTITFDGLPQEDFTTLTTQGFVFSVTSARFRNRVLSYFWVSG